MGSQQRESNLPDNYEFDDFSQNFSGYRDFLEK